MPLFWYLTETNFYPRSPCGERLRKIVSNTPIFHFYPRSPCGERRHKIRIPHGAFVISIHALLAESDRFRRPALAHRRHFYPRSPCGERLKVSPPPVPLKGISIHALLAESDWLQLFLYYQDNNFYPRSPCGERLIFTLPLVLISPFLSTLSLRRATNADCSYRSAYPISIHALLAESDHSAAAVLYCR